LPEWFILTTFAHLGCAGYYRSTVEI